MPRINVPALENENAQRVVTALAAAATTYVRPARFPKWVRRGVTMSNTLTSVGMAVAGDRRPARTRLADGGSDTVRLSGGRAVPRTGANWAAATTAGIALVTSGVAIRIDSSVEKFLLKRGVSHPRLWMAAGAAVVSLAAPSVIKQIQNSTAKMQKKALGGGRLESTLADPLGTRTHDARKGTDGTDATSGTDADAERTLQQIDAGDPSRTVRGEQDSGRRSE